MSRAILEEIVAKVRQLSPEERDDLRRLLEAERTADLDGAFAARGLAVVRPPAPVGSRAFRQYAPVPVAGEPLSETVIRERR